MSDAENKRNQDIKIDRLEFHARLKQGIDETGVEVGNVTIFVGPNNSGKSLALREMFQWLAGFDRQRRVLSEVKLSVPSNPDDVSEIVKRFQTDAPKNHQLQEDGIWVKIPNLDNRITGVSDAYEVRLTNLQSWLREPESRAFRQNIIRLLTLRLRAQTRFDLSKPSTRGNLDEPSNHLTLILTDDERRKEIRGICHSAFPDMYLALHILFSDKIGISMSKKKPKEIHEKSIMQSAKDFHASATPIDEIGDGVRSFVGMIMAIKALDYKIILIDDPEAFLHPPVARKLGFLMSSPSDDKENSVQLFISTHSADFVSGCIEANKDVTIIRLTYNSANEKATAKIVDKDTLLSLIQHPLIRSASPINSLFHNAAIIVEGGDDRVIYSEINYRLQLLDKPKGTRDSLFISAHGYQRISHILKPLRQIGIPTVAILDIDTYLIQNGLWKDFVDRGIVPMELEIEREKNRVEIKSLTRTVKQKKIFKREGLSYIKKHDKELYTKLKAIIESYREHGIFIVPVGCLESWFPDIDNEENWIEKWFEVYGAVKTDLNYITEGNEGIWEFLLDIAEWIKEN